MSRRAFSRLVSAPEEWDRRKLQVLLGVAILVVVAVAIGIGWFVQALLRGDAGLSGGDEAGGALQDVTGSTLRTTLEDAQPGQLSTSTADTITLPPAGTLGEAQVVTGFPRTAEGAMAQLIAIDERALQSASVVTAQDVIAAWAAPGGPTSQTWSGVEAVTVLLSTAGLPADGATELQVELRPAMGYLREVSDGAAVPCVDFVVTVTPGTAPASRIAVADCQRMVWQDDRWMIGPGDEPMPSPSLWPGTQASYDAGYQWLEVGA